MTFALGTPGALGIDERPLFTDDECARIVELAEAVGAWGSAGIYPGGPAEGELRSSGVVDLDDRSTGTVPLPDDGTGWPASQLLEGLVEANDERFRFDLETIPAHDLPSVLRYDAGTADHFRPHRDMGPFAPTRKLTFTVQLSDPSSYRGGDLAFPSLGTTAARRRGTLVTFPAFEHHLVTPVVQGVRHALVGWVHGPTFR